MTVQNETQEKVKKQLIGVVTSNKMQKTINVKVSKKHRDEIYGKYVTKCRQILAHFEEDNLVIPIGTKVVIAPSNRKKSKNKSYQFIKILIEKEGNKS